MRTGLTTPRLALVLIAVWAATALLNALHQNWQAAVASLAAALAFSEIYWLRADARLKPNQAIVTAAVEPSSDMRQAARAMTEIRVALLAAGYTPEQASRQIADMIAAQDGAA